MDVDFETHGTKRSRNNQKEDQPSNGWENLPPEIIFDIVPKLPISSLVQFKYACRTWHLLTQDPALVELFNSRTLESDPCLIFHCDYPIKNQLYFIDYPANSEKERVKRIDIPFSTSLPEFDVVGSSNGLLCLSDTLYYDSVYIYNPFARDYIELPKNANQYPNPEIVFGFGFHPITKEYKVLKIVYYANRNRGCYLTPPQSDVEILTLGSNKWRSIGKVVHCLKQWPASILVNGRLHWLNWQPTFHRHTLISFDLADEQFREISEPDGCEVGRFNYPLLVIRGCLSVVQYSTCGKLAVWVMKDYGVKDSWVKEFNIESYVPNALKQVNNSVKITKSAAKGKFVRVLCVLKNNKILLEYKSTALAVYDPQSDEFQDLKFFGMPSWFKTVVHVGSLNRIQTFIEVGEC